MFLYRATVMRLGAPEEERLRVAFRKRDLPELAQPVRYIPCVLCNNLMNRTNFGLVSGVIVDVCKQDGVWFDCGEINKTIAFIESGGLKKTEVVEQRRKATERAADEERWQKARQPVMTGIGYEAYAEEYHARLLIDAFITLFR